MPGTVPAPPRPASRPPPIFLPACGSSPATLEPDKLKAASFAWNGSEWRGWNYFGVAGYIKPGLRLEQMNAAQKAAAWDVLAAMWSQADLQKARNVMLLQDILAQSGNGSEPAFARSGFRSRSSARRPNTAPGACGSRAITSRNRSRCATTASCR